MIMSMQTKNIELIDKENAPVARALRKDKLTSEDLQVKKTVLGESTQPQSVIDEPSSPEDSRLLKRKRDFQKQLKSVNDFSIKLLPC